LVLGYLADSTRIRPPPNPFYKTPPALPKPHDNPFKSPAPQVTPNAQSHRQRGRNTNLFPQSHEKKARFVDRPTDDTEWMNDFGDPGPMIFNRADQVFRATAPENSSFNNVIPYDGAHAPMGDSSTERDSAVLEWRKRNRKDGFVEMQTYGGKAEKKKSRNPFVKGPPGAFYQGLRAVSVSSLQPIISFCKSSKTLCDKITVADFILGYGRETCQWFVPKGSYSQGATTK
jgi:hypothetical protein